MLGSAKITAAAVDAAGNVYLTGSTEDASFQTTPGVVQPNFGGGTCVSYFGGPLNPSGYTCDDAIVVKLDPMGNLVFATFLGGGGLDDGTAIAVDVSGNIYVAGTTSASSQNVPNNFPVTSGAAFNFTNESAFAPLGFIAKLNPSGTRLLYSTLIPAAVAGIAVDTQDNACFSATVLAPAFPTTPGAFQTSGVEGWSHAIAGKLNPAGSALSYGTYLGGTGNDYAAGIAIDAAGDVYITGMTGSPDFPVTAGALETTLPSPTLWSAFVTKLNPSGSSLIYSTYLGGSDYDYGTAVRVDGQGNAYVLGVAGSSDFPVTSGAFQSTVSQGQWLPGSPAGFLSKLNPSGSALVYSTYLSGADAFDIDPAGDAYVTGQAGAGFPVSSGALQRCLAGGGTDLFVASFDPQGALAAATYFGGAGVDTPGAIAAFPDGTQIVAGETTSPDFTGAQAGLNVSPVAFAAKLQIADPSRKASPCMAFALENAASFAEGPIAAGELVTLRGLGLGPDNGVAQELDSAGVRVFFDNTPAPLLYVQSQQINAQAPWELAGKTTQVHVEYNGASSNTASISVAPAAPGIFRLTYDSPQGAILNQGGTVNSAANPAPLGSIVAIFGTGGGWTSPAGVLGGLTPLSPLEFLTQRVTVLIDGFNADVLYEGAAPGATSGLFQVNARIPDDILAGAAEVSMSVAGIATPNLSVTVAVK
jgi:uncharacterized protein (TIGR03437 family)